MRISRRISAQRDALKRLRDDLKVFQLHEDDSLAQPRSRLRRGPEAFLRGEALAAREGSGSLVEVWLCATMLASFPIPGGASRFLHQCPGGPEGPPSHGAGTSVEIRVSVKTWASFPIPGGTSRD